MLFELQSELLHYLNFILILEQLSFFSVWLSWKGVKGEISLSDPLQPVVIVASLPLQPVHSAPPSALLQIYKWLLSLAFSTEHTHNNVYSARR